MEVWKDLIGHEGLYKISNFGNVKSCYRTKLLKPYINDEGYCKVHLSSAPYISKLHSVHRLVAIHFVENIDNKGTVDHIDGNKQNNHYSNLQWMTTQENTSKGWETNYKNRQSTKHPHSKLNDIYVQDIRIMLIGRKYPIRFIAKVYGVTLGTIHAIRRGETWKHVA